jgi:hypothetical protein
MQEQLFYSCRYLHTAVVVNKAAVTSEVFLPWKAFFVGRRVVGLREYSFRSSSPPAFQNSSMKRLTCNLSLVVGTEFAMREGELLQQLMVVNPSASLIKLIVVFGLLILMGVEARVFS